MSNGYSRHALAKQRLIRQEWSNSRRRSDYGFDERGASLLLGQAMEFEISNVVDPEFTIVAKMRKRFLGHR